ncbi:MAG: hypothetical protein DRI97_18715 [Bacteroidetes bacterium]|nr:MAG: hypothetical protein DRI97_18715 [Bacteroidota bacterium]
MAGALFSSAEFIQMNHLLGLGIGVVMIGVSCWIAEKHINIPYNLGMLSTTVIKHTLVSGFILAIGIGLTGLFGFLIVKNLI